LDPELYRRIQILSHESKVDPERADELGDLFFELSNEDRLKILDRLRAESSRLSHVSKELSLNLQETFRHVNRLDDAGLVRKDVEGLYHLTPFGEMILGYVRDLEFMTQNRDYFIDHTSSLLPSGFVKQLGALSEGTRTDNVMEFLHLIENLIQGAENYVWLKVDQYPINALGSIVEALNRGVRIRIIEKREMTSGPYLTLDSPELLEAMARARSTPLVEQKVLDEIDALLFLSEHIGLIAFPTIKGDFDYRGFIIKDESGLKHCGELFEHYWTIADERTRVTPVREIRRRHGKTPAEPRGRIVVEGSNDPAVDFQAVQDAVNNFDVVELTGIFNFGASAVQVNRSVIIRGTGKNEWGHPSTAVYKRGWAFPFRELDYVFRIEGEGADVSIENLSFTDFNGACIGAFLGNRLRIMENRITLPSGYGRGFTWGTFGEGIFGIIINATPEALAAGLSLFPGGVEIKDNWLDLDMEAPPFLSKKNVEEDPEYRPRLPEHEYYIIMGIHVQDASGEVTLEGNTVRNANARGIMTLDNESSAEVYIRRNVVESNAYGSYPFTCIEAGIGIMAQSSFSKPRRGFHLEIEENTIRCNKLNYCGIRVDGPMMDAEGMGKFSEGLIVGNEIELTDGHMGIHLRKSDRFLVSRNSISGNAYYGVRVSGWTGPGGLDLRALGNVIEDNDMKALEIREPDAYSDNWADGRMFAVGPEGSRTANCWLGPSTQGNKVRLPADETVIDEGGGNEISHVKVA